MRVIPIWVKFQNLPLNCWGLDSLSRISSVLGVPLYADDCTSNQRRVSFARVLVELDVTKALPEKMAIETATGEIFQQSVEYEWLPPYCKKCFQIGHCCEDRMQETRMGNGWVVKKWVPKKKPLPDTPRQETQPQLQNLTPDNVIVPINSDEEEGWQPINRKQESKLPGKKSTEQLFCLAESEQEGDPAGMVEDPGPHHQ